MYLSETTQTKKSDSVRKLQRAPVKEPTGCSPMAASSSLKNCRQQNRALQPQVKSHLNPTWLQNQWEHFLLQRISTYEV